MPEDAPQHRIGRFFVSALAVVLTLVIIAGLIFGMKEYQTLREQVAGLRTQVVEAEGTIGETRELLALLAEGNQLLRSKLSEQENFREETNEVVSEMEEQRAELLSQLVVLETELSAQREALASGDISRLIGEWSPRVARVECLFSLPDGRAARSVGSAVGITENNALSFVTNKHVVTGQADYVPQQCNVILDGGDDRQLPGNAVRVSAEKDLGWMPISDASGEFAEISGQLPVCPRKPNLGDPVVILGYPSVGSMESITATEGIISGYDGDMYVTSAKIERGNSGGAAIDVKNNCFLGIPTLVVVGKIESLARILPL